MFSLLKKTSLPAHTDKVWKTRQACLKGMMTEALQVISKSGKPIIISWFDDRHQSLLDFLNQYQVPYVLMDEYFELTDDKATYILKAGLVSTSLHSASLKAKQKTVIADGHFPLMEYENKIIEKLLGGESKTPVLFCLSLEDPLLKSIGSNAILQLLEKLGLGENESLDHPMIQKAIERAQEKISSNVISEIRTQNEDEWFIRNVKK